MFQGIPYPWEHGLKKSTERWSRGFCPSWRRLALYMGRAGLGARHSPLIFSPLGCHCSLTQLFCPGSVRQFPCLHMDLPIKLASALFPKGFWLFDLSLRLLDCAISFYGLLQVSEHSGSKNLSCGLGPELLAVGFWHVGSASLILAFRPWIWVFGGPLHPNTAFDGRRTWGGFLFCQVWPPRRA